jgi:hypothetical protein
MPKLDEELARLLERIPADDLKDLVAMHGAGKLGRQVKVRAKHWIAGNWAKVLFEEPHPLVAGIIGLCWLPVIAVIYLLVGLAFGWFPPH